MKYKASWKGHLRVDDRGRVYWDGYRIGFIRSEHADGAKSPGGMVTNVVWVTHGGERFRSKLAALNHLISQCKPIPACGATQCPGCVNCGRGQSNR